MKVYKIKVKNYMLNKATPDFTFMRVWNNDIPMPVNEMEGIIIRETNGMYFMKLKAHNDINWEGWVIKSSILEKTEIGESPEKLKINLDIKDEKIFISFDYNIDTVNLIKENFIVRKYNMNTKTWELNINDFNRILNVFKDYDINMNAESKSCLNHDKITLDYKFKTDPFQHQLEGFEFGLNHNKWLLADEQGLGKTKTVIDIALARKQQNPELKKCLIICGVNGLKYNWQNEISKHSNESGWILGQSKGERASNDDKLHELENLKEIESFFIITNIETLRYCRKSGNKIRKGGRYVDEKVYMITDKIIDLILRKKIGMIIVDEFHKVKNPESEQSIQLLRLDCPIKIALTGTPLMNSPLDLYSMLKWLGLENHSFYIFKNHYCQFGGYGNYEIIGYKNLSELQTKLQMIMLRRLKRDVFDLPEKLFVDEYVEMNKDQRSIYNEVRNDLKQNIDKIVNSPNPLSQLIRLRQATGYTGILSTKIQESAKLDRMEELVEEAISNDKKVVIFTNWTQMIDPVIERLSKYNIGVITGEVNMLDRSIAVQNFQENAKYKILVGTIGAMGTGLTLTAGTIEIFLDEPWNRALLDQAVDRCHRIGQQNNITIYTLLTKNTIDEKIHKLVQDKGEISDVLIDKKEINKHELINYLLD